MLKEFLETLAPEIRPGEFLIRAGMKHQQLYVVDETIHGSYIGVRKIVMITLAIAGLIPAFIMPMLDGPAKIMLIVGPPFAIFALYSALALDGHRLGKRGRAITAAELDPRFRKLPSLVPPLPAWLKNMPVALRVPIVVILAALPLVVIVGIQNLLGIGH